MQSERAARLAEAVAAMPDGPSRDRFLVVLGELEAADAATDQAPPRPPLDFPTTSTPYAQGATDAAEVWDEADAEDLDEDATAEDVVAADAEYEDAATEDADAAATEHEDAEDEEAAYGDVAAEDVEGDAAEDELAEDVEDDGADPAGTYGSADPALDSDTSALGVDDLFAAPEPPRERVPVIPAEPDAQPDQPRRRWRRKS